MEYARPILGHLADLFTEVFNLITHLDLVSPEGKVAFNQESVGGVITWETF